MVKRILAIAVIYGFTSFAWAILGATIMQRTYSSDTSLRDRVASTWGTTQEQRPPRVVTEGKKGTVLPIESSRIAVDLDLDHRQKGLLWYNTYKVGFAGVYQVRNSDPTARDVVINLPYPATQAIYDDLSIAVDGKPLALASDSARVRARTQLDPGRTAEIRIAYRSQGLDRWTYAFGEQVAQVKNFDLRMHTNFADVDFPPNTLSPTEKRRTREGWELDWKYRSLVSGFQIAMEMPDKLQPGPLAGRISFFAPVSLLFFFFLMFIITTLRGIDLHPMNYFFLAAAFFAFHLLLAYLVDHISIHAAFVICSVVSVFLVVSYLRLVVGMRFAAVEAGITQLIYLVAFSYAFFLEGATGLAITIGSILTLFLVMQMTGRIRWSERFASAGTPPPVPTPHRGRGETGAS